MGSAPCALRQPRGRGRQGLQRGQRTTRAPSDHSKLTTAGWGLLLLWITVMLSHPEGVSAPRSLFRGPAGLPIIPAGGDPLPYLAETWSLGASVALRSISKHLLWPAKPRITQGPPPTLAFSPVPPCGSLSLMPTPPLPLPHLSQGARLCPSSLPCPLPPCLVLLAWSSQAALALTQNPIKRAFCHLCCLDPALNVSSMKQE